VFMMCKCLYAMCARTFSGLSASEPPVMPSPALRLSHFASCHQDSQQGPPQLFLPRVVGPTRTKESLRLRYYHCKVGSKQVKPMALAVRWTSRITHLPCCQAGAQSGCSSPMLRIWCWTGQNLPVKAVGVSRLEKGCK
jgi:hypothetical protein